MPKVNIDHESAHSCQDAFTKIQSFFQNDQEIKKIDDNVQCHFDEKSMTGKVTGKQFKADIKITPKGSASLVEIIVDLPFLLTPFKTKIQESITRKLKKYVG